VKPIIKIIFFLSFLFVFCFIVSNSTVSAGDFLDIQQEKDSSIQRTELANKLETKSSSNQVNTKKYFYRYYPSCSVYYDIHKGLYYYLENDDWMISTSLPSDLGGNLGDYVKIEMDSDKPHLDHDKHVKDYPRKDSGKTKKNFLSKLIFLLFYEQASK